MKIYDLCGNDGLAGGICRLGFIGWNLSVGIYRCRAARAVKILKFAAFGLTHCAAAEILSRICRRGVAMGGACACALYAGLVASGRERCVRICGARCGASSKDRVQ